MHRNPVQKCKDCKKYLPHHAHGLCKVCYDRVRRAPDRCNWVEENELGWIRCGKLQHKLGLCKMHYQFIIREERNRRRREARQSQYQSNPDEEIRALQRAIEKGDTTAIGRYWRQSLRSGNLLNLEADCRAWQEAFDSGNSDRLKELPAMVEHIAGRVYEIANLAFNTFLRLGTGYLVHEMSGSDERIPEVDLDTIETIGSLRGYSPPPHPGFLQPFVVGLPDYISPIGHYGVMPHSELAMHSRIAGLPIIRYALWEAGPNHPWREPDDVGAVRVELVDESTDYQQVAGHGASPTEVLSTEIRQELGTDAAPSSRPKMPDDLGPVAMVMKATITRRVFWPKDVMARAADLQLFIYPESCEIYWRLNHCFDHTYREEFSRALREIPGIIEAV